MSAKVAIVGAGITGLTTAIAARKGGADVTVFEAAPNLRPMGAALSIWRNAMWCLEDLGVDAALRQAGAPLTGIAARHPDGRPLMQVDLSSLHADLGAVSLCLTRTDLQTALAHALPDGVATLGAPVRAVTEDASGAHVTLENGTVHSADLVVAADGIRSPIRQTLLKDGAPSPVGYGAVLGIAPTSDAVPHWLGPAEATEIYGPNGRFGIIPCGGGRVYWFFVSRRIPAKMGVQTVDEAWLTSALSVWPDYARALARATPADQRPVVHFHDRPAAAHWGRQRVLLAGDAAHPFAPNFGQGACQGIEDAHALGEGLARGLAGSDLSRFYHDCRKARADGFITENRRSGQLTQAETHLHRAMRRAALALTPSRTVLSTFRRHLQPPVYPA